MNDEHPKCPKCNKPMKAFYAFRVLKRPRGYSQCKNCGIIIHDEDGCIVKDRASSRLKGKGGLNEQKRFEKTLLRLFHRLMCLGWGIVRQIKNGDVLMAIKAGVIATTIITIPIFLVWGLFCILLTIPFDWLRACLIWLLIFILAILGGQTDEIRKKRGF